MTTKTFMQYTEYDLYSKDECAVEVPCRDPRKIDFTKLNWWVAPTFLGFPTEFRFFDADVTQDANGKDLVGPPRNISKNYQVAEAVMPLGEYRHHAAKELAGLPRVKPGSLRAFAEEFRNCGSLRRAFKAARTRREKIPEWYIRQVDDTLNRAKQAGATHIALWDLKSAAPPIVVTPDMIVLDRKLNQLYPAEPGAAPAPKP